MPSRITEAHRVSLPLYTYMQCSRLWLDRAPDESARIHIRARGAALVARRIYRAAVRNGELFRGRAGPGVSFARTRLFIGGRGKFAPGRIINRRRNSRNGCSRPRATDGPPAYSAPPRGFAKLAGFFSDDRFESPHQRDIHISCGLFTRFTCITIGVAVVARLLRGLQSWTTAAQKYHFN